MLLPEWPQMKSLACWGLGFLFCKTMIITPALSSTILYWTLRSLLRRMTSRLLFLPQKNKFNHNNKKHLSRGTWVAQSVRCLPLAQVMFPALWDQAPHRVPCSSGKPASLSLSACYSPCLCFLSLSNK